MTIVGRTPPISDAAGLRYVLVPHNTKMGAAKGAVLTAEHMVDAGKI